jgi:hypothetical protein
LLFYCFSYQTFLTGAQSCDYFHIFFRIVEQRLKHRVIFVSQQRPLAKTELIHILRQAVAAVKVIQIVWDTTEDHVAADYVIPGHTHTLDCEKFLTFSQREWF